jgi:hypothetical protein
MLVTLSGMVKEAAVFPDGYPINVVLALLYNTPLSELYVALPESTFIAVRLVQALKALDQMLVTLLGMVTLARLAQLQKVSAPMVVTLFGMVMLVRLVQSPKAYLLMLVTLFGMVTLVRLAQKAKALSPMLVTPYGMVTLVRLVQSQKAFLPMPVTGRPCMRSGILTAVFEPVYLAISIPFPLRSTRKSLLHAPTAITAVKTSPITFALLLMLSPVVCPLYHN